MIILLTSRLLAILNGRDSQVSLGTGRNSEICPGKDGQGKETNQGWWKPGGSQDVGENLATFVFVDAPIVLMRSGAISLFYLS